VDEIEIALSIALKKEADRIENPIKCFITHNNCKNCQPLCIHRRKQEDKQAKLDRIRILYEEVRKIESEIEQLRDELNVIEDLEY